MDSSARTSLPCVFAGALHGVVSLPRAADTAVFAFAQHGQMQLDTAPGTLLCPEGSYLYIPFVSDTSLSADCASLVLLRTAVPEDLGLSVYPGVYSDSEISSLMDSIRVLSSQAGDDVRLSLTGLSHAVLSRHVAISLPDETDRARIRAGARMLEHDFLKNDPVSRYAEACGMHENRFRSLFIKVYGCSPVDYRNRLRLDRARDLIRLFGLPVNAAADACGFNSVSYFCRLYKKVFGVNPGGNADAD